MKAPVGRVDPFFVDDFRADALNAGDEVWLSVQSGVTTAVLSFTSDQAEDLTVELYRANLAAAKARFAADTVNCADPSLVDQVTVVAEFDLKKVESAVLIEFASTVREPQRLLLDRCLAKELLRALQGALETSGTAH